MIQQIPFDITKLLNRPPNTSSIYTIFDTLRESESNLVGMRLECVDGMTLRDRIIMKFAHLLYVTKFSFASHAISH